MNYSSSAAPLALPPVAVLYQSVAPPPIHGIPKPLKPGGYSDSSADIAAALTRAGVRAITPSSEQPDEQQPLDWTWGDSEQDVLTAVQAGAKVLWVNTVLHARHALMSVRVPDDVRVVGHAPRHVERGDDKFNMNQEMAQHGVPVARSVLVSSTATQYHSHSVLPLSTFLSSLPFTAPAVAKPIRGRGSQGVALCPTADSLVLHVQSLLSQRDVYGDVVMVEEWLAGEEITVSVFPPGQYDAPIGHQPSHWSLPVVRRTGHVDGIAPYNGLVPVALNSAALVEEDEPDATKRAAYAAYAAIRQHCATVGRLLNAVACLRIDCRANDAGEFVLFDINMKPNMTGPGRPGREQQTSLVGLAAGAAGWSYEQLCVNIVRQARPLAELQKM